MNDKLRDIKISNTTIEQLWESRHPITYNTRTGQQLPIEKLKLVFDRKFHNLKDVSTIVEILKLNKSIIQNSRDEYDSLIAWHLGTNTDSPRPQQAQLGSTPLKLEVVAPDDDPPYDDEENEDDYVDTGAVWKPRI